VRVWYLDRTESVCPGCARGCSISVHTSTQRPWHNDGKRVARIKPRYNPDVNGHWICDEGRYSYKTLDDGRLGKVMRLQGVREQLDWARAAAEIRPHLEKGGLAVAASGLLSNEDWKAFKTLFVDELKCDKLYFSAEPDQVGEEDALLRRREKVPNLMGAQALGLKSRSFDELAAELEAGKVKTLFVIERDLAKVWGEARASGLLAKAQMTVLLSPFKGTLGERYHYRLPSTAYVEEEGHFTNFEGKVQPYKRALDPIGDARPEWSALELLMGAGVPA
jgi:NADH-quinone oxidoreductase subunit G